MNYIDAHLVLMLHVRIRWSLVAEILMLVYEGIVLT